MSQPLLLLHGALGSEEQLIPLQLLLSENRQVYTLNFEGHANLKTNRDFSISLFRENVISFLNEKNIASVDIFGFSMGGYVALDLAFHNPSLVKRIITLGTKFSWNPDFAAKEIKMLDPEKILEKVPAFATQLQKLQGVENWRKVVLKTAELMRNLGDNPPLQKTEFNRISNPVMICLGELDKMATVSESKEVAQLLQNGAFRALENFKHPIETVPIQELADIINTFLNDKN